MNYKSFLTDTWTKFSQLFNKFVKKTFVGTRAEWDLLSAAEKKQYDLADFTDDTASGVPIISDTVAEGDMNAVTSNAVAKKLLKYKTIEKTESSTYDYPVGLPPGCIPVSCICQNYNNIVCLMYLSSDTLVVSFRQAAGLGYAEGALGALAIIYYMEA